MITPDEQSAIDMIRQSARSFGSESGLKRIRAQRFVPPGFDRTVWAEMCGLGWSAIRVPEGKGGVGLGMLAYCALAEELGAGLAPEPLIGAVLAASLLDGEALKRQIAGDWLALPAWQDGRDVVSVDAPLALSGGKLAGSKLHVGVAQGADAFIVLGKGQAALVDARAYGVDIVPSPLQDGGSSARVLFDAVAVDVRAVDPEPAIAEATLATSAYLLGLMDRAAAMTVDYLKTRVQFGKVIGSFQVLQHMAVDVRLEIELTRASVEDAALQCDRSGPTAASYAAVSRAKARASQAALKVTRDCVQMHGGIGFTDEHDIGLYLRKALVVAAQFGSAKAHRVRFAALAPAGPEAA
jgi:alkylation response protein AidB-like acyl-CoA dehydrogenase